MFLVVFRICACYLKMNATQPINVLLILGYVTDRQIRAPRPLGCNVTMASSIEPAVTFPPVKTSLPLVLLLFGALRPLVSLLCLLLRRWHRVSGKHPTPGHELPARHRDRSGRWGPTVRRLSETCRLAPPGWTQLEGPGLTCHLLVYL